jgi:hypothetical protein
MAGKKIHEQIDEAIPDFGHWKDHDIYQKEFEKLLRDLRPESQSGPGTGTSSSIVLGVNPD